MRGRKRTIAAAVVLAIVLLSAVLVELMCSSVAAWTAGHPVTVNSGFALFALAATYLVFEAWRQYQASTRFGRVIGIALRRLLDGGPAAVLLATACKPFHVGDQVIGELAKRRRASWKQLDDVVGLLTVSPAAASTFADLARWHDRVGLLQLRPIDPARTGAKANEYTEAAHKEMWSACLNDLRRIVEASSADGDTRAHLKQFLALAAFSPAWHDKHAKWRSAWDSP